MEFFILVQVFVALASVCGYYYYKFGRSPNQSKTTPTSKSPVKRKWGHWEPLDWKYPPVKPWDEFDLEKTRPPMYRAFKYEHKVTMGIRAMKFDEWIELDNQFRYYFNLREERVKERGELVCKTLPKAKEAAKELCLELAEFQSQRYPHIFSITRRQPGEKGWFSNDGEIRTISIPEFGATFDLDEQDPLYIAGMLVQDDLALMMEGEDSLYYLQGGFIALAGSWRLQDKIGKDLRYIHVSGNVPEYMKKLDLSMTRFHQKLQPKEPVIRNNYSIVQGDELAWSTQTEGPEDVFDQNLKGPRKDSLEAKTFEPPKPTDNVERDVYLRQERQTLRRLPKSGAVVFTIHSYLERISDMIEEPGLPGRLASTMRSWSNDVYHHKNGKLYHPLLLPWLDKAHQDQVEAGIVPDGKVPFAYPY